METALSALAGIGLAAACGFRVFVPLLVLSLAARTGHMTLGHGFGWIASYPALLSVLAVTLPVLAVLAVLFLLFVGVRRFLFRRPSPRAT